MRSLVFPPLQGDSDEVYDSFVVLRIANTADNKIQDEEASFAVH